MQDDIDRDAIGGKREQRPGDSLNAVAPRFAPVAGNQQAQAPAAKPASALAGRQWPGGLAQGIDSRVAGYEYKAADPVAAQIRGIARGGREQQVGNPVDRDSILLLRPRLRWVEAAQTSLDMGKRDASFACRQRPTERARRVALNDYQVGPLKGQGAFGRGAYQVGVNHRVYLAGAGKRTEIKLGQLVAGELQTGMLAGD